ncbi:nucleotide sugar dehydrogenase [Candidatus Woesearchaeota archaeon]|nr:nucleotide sugar dehydrogenase [Candidatus Woesearchaeota archaeon]
MMDKKTVCIVGLGYVGLPLAVLFSKTDLLTIGFDISKKRIEELKKGIDSTKQTSENDLKTSRIEFTSDETRINEAAYVVVAVPTPIDEGSEEPDLSFVESATVTIGRNLKKNAIVVYESTVYPGVTEDICVPILEKESGMKYPADFKTGYSPERVNPSDTVHTTENIVKIVSGCDEKSLDEIAKLYGKIIKAGVYRAKSIKTAEAAKVIENTQRDLNIALVNELSLIFRKMGLNTKEVIEAAGTKWNFQKYQPGLVGGHCISVDPYYLVHKSKALGHTPKLILAAREVNEHMAVHIARLVISGIKDIGKDINKAKVLVMGLSFKENINDTRNSKILHVIDELKKQGCDVHAHDPLLTEQTIRDEFRVESGDATKTKTKYDAIIVSVIHDQFKKMGISDLKKIACEKAVLMDIKSHYSTEEARRNGFIYYCL